MSCVWPQGMKAFSHSKLRAESCPAASALGPLIAGDIEVGYAA